MSDEYDVIVEISADDMKKAAAERDNRDAEITRLREENARYKLTYQKYVEAIDRINGTPCEQIRHQQEVEALREENARLREALKPFAETDTDFYAGEKDYYVCTAVWFSIGQYRAARAALKETGDD